MKHTKMFAFALAAILLATALCACQSPSPDPADTTPAPPLSEIVETTPAETTPAETTPMETIPDMNEVWGGTILTSISYQGSAGQVFEQIDEYRENVTYAYSDIAHGFFHRTFAITSADGMENLQPYAYGGEYDLSKYNDEYFENNHLLLVTISADYSPKLNFKFNELSDNTLKIGIIQTDPNKATMEDFYPDLPYIDYVTDFWVNRNYYFVEVPGKFVDERSTGSVVSLGHQNYWNVEYTYTFAE